MRLSRAVAREFFGFVTDGVGRMQALIADLLAYSRVGSQRGGFEPADLGRHGGRIWVESEPGSGSAFHFTLPAAARPQR